MEIQQPSSVGQATALFTGLTQAQVRDTIKRIYPYAPINTNLSKNVLKEAVSSTGTFNDYRESDHIEAHRLLQGIITNPWQSIYDIEPGKADPFYYDSGVSDIQDIQQNTIGTVTGASQVNDPRLNFTENLLKMKVYHKKLDNDHSYSYLTNLFLTQVENGSTYYQTQAMRQNEALSAHMTSERMKRPPIDHGVFIKGVNMGNMHAPHNQRKRDIVVNTVPIYANNPKRVKLDALHERFTKHITSKDHSHKYTTSSTPIAPPLTTPVSTASVLSTLSVPKIVSTERHTHQPPQGWESWGNQSLTSYQDVTLSGVGGATITSTDQDELSKMFQTPHLSRLSGVSDITISGSTNNMTGFDEYGDSEEKTSNTLVRTPTKSQQHFESVTTPLMPISLNETMSNESTDVGSYTRDQTANTTSNTFQTPKQQQLVFKNLTYSPRALTFIEEYTEEVISKDPEFIHPHTFAPKELDVRTTSLDYLMRLKVDSPVLQVYQRGFVENQRKHRKKINAILKERGENIVPYNFEKPPLLPKSSVYV